MFDYLEKYKKLPKEVRDKLSAPPVMSAVSELENKYGLNLAAIVMKATVGAISLKNLDIYLIENENFPGDKAKMLAGELEQKVFSAVANYLGIKPKLSIAKKPQESIVKTDAALDIELLDREEKAGFSFSQEDDKEVKNLEKKADGYSTSVFVGENIEEKINKIFNNAKINFGSDMLAARFKNILKIYLRGIRDKIETKQTLMKDISVGGLGFDEDSARNILSIAGRGTAGLAEKPIIFNKPKKFFVPEDAVEKKEVAQISNGDLNELKKSGVRDIEYDFSSIKNKKGNDIIKKIDTKHELAPPPPSLRAREEKEERPDKYREKSAPVGKQDKIPEKGPTALKQKNIEPSLKDEVSLKNKDNNFLFGNSSEVESREKNFKLTPLDKDRQGKVRMEDIKYKPKVMGPVDELRYMDLINFRRLGLDSFESAAVIKNKINLFNEYEERQKGVAAWRQSPLNKLYLEMGGESISKNQSIDVIIEERKKAGKDYLKQPEFEAIIKLNKELRF